MIFTSKVTDVSPIHYRYVLEVWFAPLMSMYNITFYFILFETEGR